MIERGSSNGSSAPRESHFDLPRDLRRTPLDGARTANETAANRHRSPDEPRTIPASLSEPRRCPCMRMDRCRRQDLSVRTLKKIVERARVARLRRNPHPGLSSSPRLTCGMPRDAPTAPMKPPHGCQRKIIIVALIMTELVQSKNRIKSLISATMRQGRR
jgi:hypothetical protein